MLRGVYWPALLTELPSPPKLPGCGAAAVETRTAGVRIEELIVVQYVGENYRELRADALGNVDRFLDAEVQVPVVQATNIAGEAAIPGVQA